MWPHLAAKEAGNVVFVWAVNAWLRLVLLWKTGREDNWNSFPGEDGLSLTCVASPCVSTRLSEMGGALCRVAVRSQ